MKRLFYIVGDVTRDIYYGIIMFYQNNMYNIGVLLSISLPYLMLYIGGRLYQQRGTLAIGGEIFIPLIVSFIASLFKRAANKINKGYDIPIYSKRFTEEDGDGEVTIKQDEIQEIILYLADVENYIEKRGIAKWEKKKRR